MSVFVIGTGHTKFGELWEKNVQNLLFEAQVEALNDAGIQPQDLDQIVVGNMAGQVLTSKSLLGPIAASVLEVSVPSYRVEGACASGGLALYVGVQAIQSGQADVVLVTGIEKMTDVSGEQARSAMISASDSDTEAFSGATMPGLFALVARVYMETYGVTKEDLAYVSVKNHEHGLLNPLAHLRKKFTVEQVLQSPLVADPLTLLDCSPISDGAASLVLCSQAFAKKHTGNKIKVLSSCMAVDNITLAQRRDLISLSATRQAAAAAYKKAGVTPDDIDVVEVHDAFTIAELIGLEDLSFFEPGKAAQATRDGVTSLQGTLPVNPSGGLKSKGHPVGATGVAQAVEIVRQLRGQCEQRQVADAKIGLAHNVGGIGTMVTVSIFGRE